MLTSLRRFVLTCGAYLIAAFPLAAQETTWDYIGGCFGGSDFHVRDDHASPMIYSAWGIAPALQYLHAGGGNRQYAEASFFSAVLSSGPPNFRTDNWRGRARYAYLGSVADFGSHDGPFRFFLGGSITSYLSRSNYYYFIKPLNGYSSTIDSWYWSHSLDAALQVEYGLAEREFLTVQCFVPIVSNVSRPRYSPSGDYSYTENVWKMRMFGRTEFFPENISCDILVAFQVPVVWRFNCQVGYEFFFTSYDIPRDVKMYMNNARAGVVYCF